MTFVFEVPKEHHVHRDLVLVDQIFDDPLSGNIDRRGDYGQPVAGVQLLRRRSVEPLLERGFESATLAVVGEEVEDILMGEAAHP
jgi:hypothetical protein